MSKNMRQIRPEDIATKDLHQFIVGAIAPRPIAFVSTVDENGVANIAPYSFFNAFSSNPPVLVFSSNRRVSDNTTKDTLHNVKVNQEVVVNVVNYEIVRQMTIASISYPSEVSEFDKAGLTPLESETVQPARIAESPVHFECKVSEIIPLGDHGGAGHLIICKVQRIHIDEAVIDDRNRIDPHKLDLVGRLGRAHYVRASGDALFDIYQAPMEIALGFDQLPEHIRCSEALSGNEIADFAGCYHIPTTEQVTELLASNANLQQLVDQNDSKAVFALAKKLLKEGEVEKAFTALMALA